MLVKGTITRKNVIFLFDCIQYTAYYNRFLYGTLSTLLKPKLFIKKFKKVKLYSLFAEGPGRR